MLVKYLANYKYFPVYCGRILLDFPFLRCYKKAKVF